MLGQFGGEVVQSRVKLLLRSVRTNVKAPQPGTPQGRYKLEAILLLSIRHPPTVKVKDARRIDDLDRAIWNLTAIETETDGFAGNVEPLDGWGNRQSGEGKSVTLTTAVYVS